MNNIRGVIDDYLDKYFLDKGTYEKRIYESMRYSLVNGGKRIRPLLTVLCHRLFSGDDYKVIPMACAVEMIHTYSLIHDDLPAMDDDALRRGNPTNHIKFDEATAILAGDGLLNEAFNIIIEQSLKYGNKHLEAGKVLGEAAGVNGMIGGQVVDIQSEGKEITMEQLRFIHEKKTGALLKASILVGSIIGGASKEEIEILSEFGSKIGLAFQIIDDILDVVGDEKKVGKNLRTDSQSDKNTYTKFYSIDECRGFARSLTIECNRLLDKIPYNTKNLRELTSFLLERDY